MTIERVLPVEVVLRDLAAWAKRPSTGEPYCLWIDGINAALKERDAEIERLKDAVQERDGVIEMILLRELRLREALNQAAEALDLAQALLERSSHHPKILEAYKQASAALPRKEGKA